MNTIHEFLLKTEIAIIICLIFATNSYAESFDVLEKDYSYSFFKNVYDNGFDFPGSENLEILAVENSDVEPTTFDMLCHRSDHTDTKLRPRLGHAIIESITPNDLSDRFNWLSDGEANQTLPSPLFYVVAATENYYSVGGEDIFSSPADKFKKIPLELVKQAERANREAYDDLTYRYVLDFRDDRNEIMLHFLYGHGTGEPYGLGFVEGVIPLDFENSLPLKNIFAYGKHRRDNWFLQNNPSLNDYKGLYYRLPKLNKEEVATHLIWQSSGVAYGKQLKLKRLSNNKYALRILHYKQLFNVPWDNTSLYYFTKIFSPQPYIEEYCFQR